MDQLNILILDINNDEIDILQAILIRYDGDLGSLAILLDLQLYDDDDEILEVAALSGICYSCEEMKLIDHKLGKYNICDDCILEVLYCQTCGVLDFKDDANYNCECGYDMIHDCKAKWWKCGSPDGFNCDDHARAEAESDAQYEYELERAGGLDAVQERERERYYVARYGEY